MSIKVTSNNIHSNKIKLLPSATSSQVGVDSSESLGSQTRKQRERLLSLLSSSLKEPEYISGSKALKQLKLLASDNYDIDAKSNAEKHHEFNGATAHNQLDAELKNPDLTEAQRAVLADTAISLLKQGTPDKFTQEQLIQLSQHASQSGKVDLYISLMSNHNQSNKNVVDMLLPEDLAHSLRTGDALNTQEGQGFSALELVSMSSRAYQARNNDNTPFLNGANNDNRVILQLLTQDSFSAVKEQDNAIVTALAYSNISADMQQDSITTTIRHNNPYSAAVTLATMFSRTDDTDAFIERDIANLSSIIVKSSDSSFLLEKIAQSGHLSNTTLNKLYNSILRHNDVKKDSKATADFIKALDTNQKIDSKGLLGIYKKTLMRSKSQPIGEALDEIYKKASELERANHNEEVSSYKESQEKNQEDYSASYKEISALHDYASRKKNDILNNTSNTIAELTNINFKVLGSDGLEREVSLANISSAAHLNMMLDELQATEVVIPDNSKEDNYLTTDIKIALEDYINGVDDRISLYLSEPISESLPQLADILKTDTFHLTSMIDESNLTTVRREPLKDSLADLDAKIIIRANDVDTKAKVVETSKVRSNFEFKKLINVVCKNMNGDSGGIKIDIESDKLDKRFSAEIAEKLTVTAREYKNEANNPTQNRMVNKDIDNILCLPVTSISDKMKTNTIFNDKHEEPQNKSTYNKLSR